MNGAIEITTVRQVVLVSARPKRATSGLCLRPWIHVDAPGVFGGPQKKCVVLETARRSTCHDDPTQLTLHSLLACRKTKGPVAHRSQQLYTSRAPNRPQKFTPHETRTHHRTRTRREGIRQHAVPDVSISTRSPAASASTAARPP